MKKKVSVVVSVYNEEGALPRFYEEARGVLDKTGWDYELLFVNDGSADGSRGLLEDLSDRDGRVKLIHFSRNFGHEAAMIAGLDYSVGDAVICMDADLQHPPGCIPEILQKMEEGCDVISMVRTKNETAGRIKNLTSAGFYRVLNAIAEVQLEENASDFFAVSARAADVLRKNYREKIRFLRGYVQNIGFKRAVLCYEARQRVAGESKYSLKKLFAFSMNTIMCFSDLPLKLGIYAGGFAGLLGVIMAAYTVWSYMKVGTPNGYATIVVLMCFMFSILFLIVGIIGNYIAVLFSELKDRPIYIVEETRNL